MTEGTPINFSAQELDQFQRLRISVLAFQNMIATLPADDQNDARNEQFNRLWLEAKALLKDQTFNKKVSKAVTQEGLIDRQRAVFPRLSGIVIFGVILALLGLGVNSIILDDFVINSLGCLVSSGGMALVVGAFMVWLWHNSRRRLSNLGELYLNCNTLLFEINHALNQAIPGAVGEARVTGYETPSALALLLDSLHKQVGDWQHKLRTLEEQRLTLGQDAPLEIKLNQDFVQRELNRVTQELERLSGRSEMPLNPQPVINAPFGPKILIPAGPIDPASAQRRARSVTLDMPASGPEDAEILSEE